jgi:hypothetical protein
MLVVFAAGRELGAFSGRDGGKIASPIGDDADFGNAPAATVSPVSPTLLPVS